MKQTKQNQKKKTPDVTDLVKKKKKPLNQNMKFPMLVAQ